MATAKVERLANRVRADIEELFSTQPAKRQEYLRLLLETIVTAEPPEALEALAGEGSARGLRTYLRRLEKYLKTMSCLPEAICSRFKYRSSQLQVMSGYRISRRAWDYFMGLAKDVDWDPELQVPVIRYESLPWHDQLEEEVVHVEVVLDARALEGMVVSALEGYLSPKGRHRKGYEVYGINLGMVREIHRRQPRSGIQLTKYVYVMHSQPQLSAEGGSDYVTPNPRSLRAILDATGAMYPQYQAVGDFHSHLYRDFAEMDDHKGWECSTGDEASNRQLAEAMAEHGHPMLIAFVLAIARSTRRVSRDGFRGLKNTLQLSLGDCRIVIGAYRNLESGRLTRTNTRLSLSGIAR